MKGVALDLTGHRELDRAFRRLEGKPQRAVTRTAMRTAWRIVLAATG